MKFPSCPNETTNALGEHFKMFQIFNNLFFKCAFREFVCHPPPTDILKKLSKSLIGMRKI